MSGLTANVGIKRGNFELDVELALPSRGITALLGPSGSGKSSVLRMLAGLDRPHSGYINNGETIWYDQQQKIFLPPQQRRIGMVFQDYALFSHLSVASNVGYGLPRTGREQHVTQWLKRLQLDKHAQHFPSQLSGGQRQRVALARALATDPDLLLLDEPFSAIDVSLRQNLRYQLKDLVADTHQPVVIVSHHLEDALLLADNVGVMIDGHILQFGETQHVFMNPNCRHVAQVLGWHNFLPIRSIMGHTVSGAWGELLLDSEPDVETAWIGIRPEHLRIAGADQASIKATVTAIHQLGAIRAVQCRLADGTQLEMHLHWDEPVPVAGSDVRLHLPLAYARAMPDCVIKRRHRPIINRQNTNPLCSNG